eukprot:g15107.t1
MALRFAACGFTLGGFAIHAEPLAELNHGPSALVDVFPEPSYQPEHPGRFMASSDYEPTPGPWMEGIDESEVFRVSLKHEQDPLNSYELRMGVGGQVYSLQSAFGESVPPSWRRNGPTSPWNDEVWQFVAVCTRYNTARNQPDWLKAAEPYKTSFFVHNSGCYTKDAAPGVDLKNLYCPLLASEIDTDARVYRQVNWGMVPQMRTIHRSPILFYTQVRDAGEGVIELTWVVHNFSTRDDVVFDYLNAPWGGTRVSTLPLTYVARPDGSLMPDASAEDDPGPFFRGKDVRTTGGYTISCVDESENSPSLALVFGRDKHRETQARLKKQGKDYVQFKPSRYRSWRSNHPAYHRQWKDFQTMPANSFRNYQVVEFVPRLYLRPQETIWYRSYLVVGGKKNCAGLAASLVDHVDYGSLTFSESDTPMVALPGQAGREPGQLYAHPVRGTLPVIALRQKPDGKVLYTTDPYRLTPKEKLDLPVPKNHKDEDYYSKAVGYTLDGQTEFLGLIGFARREAPADPSGWQRLSETAPGFWDGQADEHHVDDPGEFVEHAVDEGRALFAAELLGEFDGFVDRDFDWRVAGGHLEVGQAQDRAVDRRLAVRRPVGGQRAGLLVGFAMLTPREQRELGGLSTHGQAVVVFVQRLGKFLGLGQHGWRVPGVVLRAGEVELVEDLHREAAQVAA